MFKSFSALTVLALTCTHASAQFGTAQVITSPIAEPQDVTGADIDGDGDLDLVAASLGDSFATGSGGLVTWYENLGGGSFGPLQVVRPLDGATSVRAADINGDGHIQLSDLLDLLQFFGLYCSEVDDL